MAMQGSYDMLLQWGRTREGAETSVGAHSPGWRIASFNGAAPVKVRKPAREWRAMTATKASMGPHP